MSTPVDNPADTYAGLWESLAPIGRDETTGGYLRFAWSAADQECRAWFADQAGRRGLSVEVDRNGNQWAWWGDPAAGDAVVTGSHLDSVPQGGAFDGPLGIVSAFAAVDRLRSDGAPPRRPLGLVTFADEEGARFGVACVGSRLLTGSLDPDRARALLDRDGESLAEVIRTAGRDPDRLGADPERLSRIGTFVELHIEQGRGLADIGAPVAVGSGIWPHGRWRLEFTGQGNHAGTTAMSDRRDPMLTFAMTALAANKQARLFGGRATMGRVEVTPNGTNAIPSRVRAWLDARAEDDAGLDALVSAVLRQAAERSERDGTTLDTRNESRTAAVLFDQPLRDRAVALLGDAPVLATGAGHDAGILASAGVRTAMLFVRNPTGISHAPQEYASPEDCQAGVDALTRVLADQLTRGG